MHLRHVKSSTTCHINISVFMDAGMILEEKGGEELSVVQFLYMCFSHISLCIQKQISVLSDGLALR